MIRTGERLLGGVRSISTRAQFFNKCLKCYLPKLGVSVRRVATRNCALLFVLIVLLTWIMIVQDDGERVQPVEDYELRLRLSLPERDASQKYNKHVFGVVARDWTKLSARPICIATHGSVDRLHGLVNMTAHWSGPVSVTIFTPDLDYQLAWKYIAYLRACYPDIGMQASFHFVYPVDRPPRGKRKETEVNCSLSYTRFLNLLLAKRSDWREEIEYPQNILRNIAKNTCPTKFILWMDIDTSLTGQGMEEQLSGFLLRKSCTRCAFVIPLYEVRENTAVLPRNKQELAQLVREGRARPYRKTWEDHIHDLWSWWDPRAYFRGLRVWRTVHHDDMWYEPVFLASRNMPSYDERFVGYGHTRHTHVYEMFLGGWTFRVLDNIFLVHWGYQTPDKLQPWRVKQQSENWARMLLFLREVSLRYDKDPLKLLSSYPMRNRRLEVTEIECNPCSVPALFDIV